MTQSPQSGQGAPLRTEFGSVTAPQHPGTEARRGTEWGSTTQTGKKGGSSGSQAPSEPHTNGAPNGSVSGSTVGAPAGAPVGNSVASPPGSVPFDSRTTTNVPTFTGPPPPPPGAPAAAVPAAKTSGSGRPGRSARARGPRRARLQLRHINPWTVLKFSCVLSIALFFVWLIVVGVLFGVLDATGVIKTLNDAYIQVNPGAQAPIRAGIVFGGAAIIGAVNIILFIALSTVGAVVYNLCADLVGGVEITLSER